MNAPNDNGRAVTNFGGNLRFTPRRCYIPTNEAEIMALPDRHAHDKVRKAALFHGRLQWGKYFPLSNVEIECKYPHMEEFRHICRNVDPRGVFRNEFTDRVLGFPKPSPRN